MQETASGERRLATVEGKVASAGLEMVSWVVQRTDMSVIGVVMLQLQYLSGDLASEG